MVETKAERYDALVAARKNCGLCAGLSNPATVRGGEFDSDQLGPYSRWHADLDAELIVVAKDFAPVPKFIEYEGAPGPRVQTNMRLARRLDALGFQASVAPLSDL